MPNGGGRGFGMGRGAGRGQGRGQGRGGGMGRQGGRSLGSGGQCICTSCGHVAAHQRGVPCTDQKCPKCGAAMTRQV
jgi:hypothetical protein